MEYRRAIVKQPSVTLKDGLRENNRGAPDYALAMRQHAAYVAALRSCGLTVHVLAADADYPDSVFVEDTAVLTEHLAVIARPGALSRRGETEAVAHMVAGFYGNVMHITAPGTLDGGDVLQVGKHVYVGLSRRTNRQGIGQFREMLAPYGYAVSGVPLRRMLHLKTGAACVGERMLVLTGELAAQPLFQEYDIIVLGREEGYAANCLRINDRLILPAGYPSARQKLAALGVDIIPVDTSEFRKLDGGLSCLSLRF